MRTLLMRTEFNIRCMTTDEVGLIRNWADAEGWDPGVHDGPAFRAADPEGFFIGLAGERPVSCISCIRYGDDYGFVDQYIVRPECRGLGYGLATWNAGMGHLGGRNVGLDGVLAQVKNYERSGFRFAHHHVRYTGVGGGERPAGIIGIDQVPFEGRQL
jgi:GNAT superfamily N-acetyltransferase